MHKREGYFEYGMALLELEKYSEAIEAFEASLDITEGNDKIPDAKKTPLQRFGKATCRSEWVYKRY